MLVDVECPGCKKRHSFPDLVPFRAECDACSADLHVCLSCRFYDRFVENECREDQADPVANKDRRNLCEYWKPRIDAGVDDAAAQAKQKLAALFGDKAPASTSTTSTSSTASSSPSSSPSAPTDAAAEAKRKLDELFKKKS